SAASLGTGRVARFWVAIPALSSEQWVGWGRSRLPCPPDIPVLDLGGALCDGVREYFETSRRAYAVTWPGEPAPDEASLPAFRRLRPVIMRGWEMPMRLRALANRADDRSRRGGRCRPLGSFSPSRTA